MNIRSIEYVGLDTSVSTCVGEEGDKYAWNAPSTQTPFMQDSRAYRTDLSTYSHINHHKHQSS